ncbi:hypothetical protein [Pectobacterium versatile]|uniref:hypothetical protein n=1 Tax=Pectobacterium versatile TaxID=2488639 RepID=UPI003AFA6D9C
MNTLTNARLNKLASWRKTHGDSTDVTLPVLEIEELASRVIAAESVPSTIYVQGLLSQIAHLEGLLSKKPVPSDEANTVQRWVSHIVKGHYEYDVIMRRPSPTGSEVDYEDYADLAGETASLRAQLAELEKQEPTDFRWRYRADEHSGASAWAYMRCDRADEFIKRIADKDKCVEYGYVFARPVPQAVSQQEDTLSQIRDIFHIGGEVPLFCIVENVKNANRFADHLAGIEQEFFMVPDEEYHTEDDDQNDEPREKCLVNRWGLTTEQYVEQFRKALKHIVHPVQPAASQPYTVPDERAAYETFIAKRLGDSIDTQRARNGDPEKPDYMAWDMTVGWIAWQGRAAMLQHHSGDAANKVNHPVIPDGWALVPFEPSTEMSCAGHVYYQKSTAEFGDFTPTGMYRAMLAAAPQHKGE